MTSEFLDVQASGGLGRSPIVPEGKVTDNVFLDTRMIQQIKQTSKIVHGGKEERRGGKGALYPGAPSDDAWTILPRDPVFQHLGQSHGVQNGEIGDFVYVLATFNGMGRPGGTRWELMSRMMFRGIATGEGVAYHLKWADSPQEFAVIRGGANTVMNTGPRDISNGDWVWLSPPTPDAPYEKGIIGRQNARNPDRMPAHTMPYKVGADSLTIDSLKNILSQSESSIKEKFSDFDNPPPIVEGAIMFKEALGEISLAITHVLMSSGLFHFDESAIADPGLRSRNSTQYLNRERDTVLGRMAKILKVTEDDPHPPTATGGRSRQEKIEISLDVLAGRITDPKVGEKFVGISEFLMQTVTAETDEALLFRLEKGTRGMPGGLRGKLNAIQIGTLPKLFSSVDKANHLVKSAIIGKALSSARPGMEFDIDLGTYST